jgi:hypothetical protein
MRLHHLSQQWQVWRQLLLQLLPLLLLQLLPGLLREEGRQRVLKITFMEDSGSERWG